MPCKEKDSYVAVFETLKNEFALSPSAVMSDYEASLRAAIKEVYPNTDLKGCWFHYAQVITLVPTISFQCATLNKEKS